MINFEQKLPFRWHVNNIGTQLTSSVAAQYARRPLRVGEGLFKLYTPNDRLLPFQIFLPVTEGVNMWDWGGFEELFLMNCNGGMVVDFSLQTNLLSQIVWQSVYGEGIYIIYKGDAPVAGLNMPEGYYYLYGYNANNKEFTSEVFYVPPAGTLDKLTKIEYWNTCDLGNVIYQTGYKNRFYLDTTLLKNDPKIDETGFENGIGEFVRTSARFVDIYSMQDLIPEYLYHALVFAKMHNEIRVQIPDTLHTGKFTIDKVTPQWDEKGYWCDCAVVLEQEVRLIGEACCTNKKFGGLVKVQAVNNYIKLGWNIGYNALTYVMNGSGNNISILDNDAGIGRTIHPASVGLQTLSNGAQLQIYANGNIKFKRRTGANTTNLPHTETFSYTIVDAWGDTSTADVVITLAQAKAVNNIFTFNQNGAVGQNLGNVLQNDHVPITAPAPVIVYSGGLTAGMKQIFSSNFSGNYLLLNVYTGEVIYYDFAGVAGSGQADVFNYQFWITGSTQSNTAQITIVL